MYINTTSQSLMESSLCEVLNICKEDIDDLFETCYNKFRKDHPIFILDDQYDYLFDYVKNHMYKNIDDISLYQLGRRLDDDLDDNGYSLIDTLCHETSLSQFLKKYGFTFQYDNHIKMYLDDKEVILDKSDDYSTVFLRQMFEYNDYSFKGFAFNDAIEKNDYYEILKDGPELFGHLFSFIDNDDFLDDFMNNSHYYKYEYLVPIQQIYFENYKDLTDQEKQYHIIVKALQRLYAYQYDSVEYDEDNPIIGMIDNLTLYTCYLVNKTKI